MSIERPQEALDARLSQLAPLQDPVRRSLYLYVAAQPHEVGREEAAGAAGVSRALAAFHLDKLVDAGLLEASFRRLSGRSGPGAGRPSKLYRRSAREHHLSVPPREYELAAELLAQAAEEPGETPARSLAGVARRFGERLGREALAALGRRPSLKRRAAALPEVLGSCGYQPYREGTELRLRNCPFHSLAERHRDLCAA
jgi:predicted ArsR family transcriptional regulator